MRQAQHIQACVSIGEGRATLNDGLRRSFFNSLLMTFRAIAYLMRQVTGLPDGIKNGLDMRLLYIIY
jgi:hypothetical protein